MGYFMILHDGILQPLLGVSAESAALQHRNVQTHRAVACLRGYTDLLRIATRWEAACLLCIGGLSARGTRVGAHCMLNAVFGRHFCKGPCKGTFAHRRFAFVIPRMLTATRLLFYRRFLQTATVIPTDFALLSK